MNVTFNERYDSEGGASYYESDFDRGPAQEAGLSMPTWFQHGSPKLPLPEKPTLDSLRLLLENTRPLSGEALTLRTNTTRRSEGREVANRRTDHELTFSATKDSSLMALVLGDTRILTAFELSVWDTLLIVARYAATRIRQGGADEDRLTQHLTALLICQIETRALDPQAHAHAIGFNATWDPVEDCYKALQFAEILRHKMLIQTWAAARMHYELANLGYDIVPTTTGYGIAGVPDELIRMFSKRKASIDKAAAAIEMREHRKLGPAGRKYLALSSAGDKRSEGWASMHSRWKSELGDGWKTLKAVLDKALQRVTSERGDPTKAAGEAIDLVLPQMLEGHAALSHESLLLNTLKVARGQYHGAHAETAIKARLKAGRLVTLGKHLTSPCSFHQLQELAEKVNDSKGMAIPLIPPLSEFEPDLAGILKSRDPLLAIATSRSTVCGKVTRCLLAQLGGLSKMVTHAVPSASLARGSIKALSVALARHQGKGGILVIAQANRLAMDEFNAILDCAIGGTRVLLFAPEAALYGPEATNHLASLYRHSWLRAISLVPPSAGITNKTRTPKPRKLGFYALAQELTKRGQLLVSGDPEKAPDAAVGRAVEMLLRGISVTVLVDDPGQESFLDRAIHERFAEVNPGARQEVGSLLQLPPAAPTVGDLAVSPRKTRHFEMGRCLTVIAVPGDRVTLNSPESGETSVTRKVWDKLVRVAREPLEVCPGTPLTLTAPLQGGRLRAGDTVKVESVEPSGTIRLKSGDHLPAWFRLFRRGYCLPLSNSRHHQAGERFILVLTKRPDQATRAAVSTSVHSADTVELVTPHASWLETLKSKVIKLEARRQVDVVQAYEDHHGSGGHAPPPSEGYEQIPATEITTATAGKASAVPPATHTPGSPSVNTTPTQPEK